MDRTVGLRIAEPPQLFLALRRRGADVEVSWDRRGRAGARRRVGRGATDRGGCARWTALNRLARGLRLLGLLKRKVLRNECRWAAYARGSRPDDDQPADVAKADVVDRIPAGTRRRYDDFRECAGSRCPAVLLSDARDA